MNNVKIIAIDNYYRINGLVSMTYRHPHRKRKWVDFVNFIEVAKNKSVRIHRQMIFSGSNKSDQLSSCEHY